MSERVVTVYVCSKQQHKLAETVVLDGGDVMVRPVRVPASELREGQIRQEPYRSDEMMPLRGEPFWSTELACGGCRCEYVLTQEDAIRDVEARRERVVLHATR